MKCEPWHKGNKPASMLGFLSRDAGHSGRVRKRTIVVAGNTGERSMVRYLVSLTATALFLSACAGQSYENVGNDPEVQKTWNAAYVSLPGGISGRMTEMKIQDGLKANSDKPVILFIHGCNGFDRSDFLVRTVIGFASDMSASGYIFIIPDSFTRDFRPQACPGGKFSYTAKVDWETINRMRMEEIYYAISQVRGAPWFKSNDLFLFGQSEGGLAVAAYSGNGVNAEVIGGWGCPSYTLANRDSTLIERPVKAPPSVPVLNLKSKMDPVDTRPSDCGSSVWGRPGGSKVVNPPQGHWFMDNAEYRQEVIAFFDRNRHASALGPDKESSK